MGARSKAAQREAEAIKMLEEARRLIFRAPGEFRRDSSMTLAAGQLYAANLIVQDVIDTLKDRAER
jgi:hypothetical protein